MNGPHIIEIASDPNFDPQSASKYSTPKHRQWACEAYDHIEIPPIEPVITRITLHGGAYPCCAKTFKAAPPSDMRPGSF
jgi:hypothetical protein